MKAHRLIAFLIVFLMLPALGHAQLARKLAQHPYHSPQTPAEQAVDKAFHLKNSANATQLAGIFTPQLTHAITEDGLEKARNYCSQDETTGICGLSYYDVLLCGHKAPHSFDYQTISDDGRTALVAYGWPSPTQIGVYKLINVNGTWEIDGIDCRGTSNEYFGAFHME